MAGVFVCLQLSGGLLLDYVLPQVRFPAAYEHLRRVKAQPRSPDIICLGSSRFQGFLNEAELTHELRRRTGQADLWVLNGAVPAGDFIVQEFLLRRLLAQGARPKLLVLEISPETLNEFNEFYRLHFFRQLRWEDLPIHAASIIRTVSPGQLLSDRFLPLYRHRYQLFKQAWGWLAGRSQPDGLAPRSPMTEAMLAQLLSTPRPLSEAQNNAIFAEKRPDRPFLRNYHLGGQVVHALGRILALCRQHGITPLLIGGPVASVYRNRYTPAIQARYEDFLRQLRATYRVAYVECRAAVPDHLFADTHHPLPEGGIVFSRLLARNVLARWWLSCEHPSPALTGNERPAEIR